MANPMTFLEALAVLVLCRHNIDFALDTADKKKTNTTLTLLKFNLGGMDIDATMSLYQFDDPQEDPAYMSINLKVDDVPAFTASHVSVKDSDLPLVREFMRTVVTPKREEYRRQQRAVKEKTQQDKVAAAVEAVEKLRMLL